MDATQPVREASLEIVLQLVAMRTLLQGAHAQCADDAGAPWRREWRRRFALSASNA